MNKKKKIWTVAAIVLVIAFLSGGIYLSKVIHYQNAVKGLSISSIDISTVPDEAYEGECDVDFIYAKVKVVVEKGKIINIDLLEHKNDHGLQAEKILDKVIDQQKTDVDSISGATNSSKVIKKAIENALSNRI